MSLYNTLFKVNPATFFLLPMLGEQHPDSYPRFRDCFSTKRQFKMVDDIMMMSPIDVKEKPSNIYVLLRIGGGNRSSYVNEINELRSHPNYISDEDDPLDNTYCIFEFSCPLEWKDDYDKVNGDDLEDTSPAYQERVRKVYPKLDTQLDLIFKKKKNGQDKNGEVDT